MRKELHDKAGLLAATLQSVAHPLRLLIVCLLSRGGMYAGDIMEQLGTSKGNVSQHLRLLSDRGLLAHRREGNRVFYSLADRRLAKLMEGLKKLYCPDFKL